MKNGIAETVVMGSVLLFLLCLGAITCLAAPLTLTYATNTDATGLRGIAEKGFVEEIERLAGGRVRIKVYWQQSYLIDKEILEGVEDGTVDMGHVNINYYPKRLLKNGGITLLQQGPADYGDRMRLYRRLYREIPEFNAEFERYRQKIIYTYSVLPLAGCFTRPAVSLSDFRDRRMRAAGRWLLMILKGAGAIPVNIPWADCRPALKTNALEGVYTNLDAIHRVGLDKVAPHILVFREFWNPVPFHITVNLPRWNSLPRDVRKIIETAARNSERKFAALYETMLEEIVAAQKASGCTVTFAGRRDIEGWLSLEEVDKAKALWVKEVNLSTVRGDAAGILGRLEEIAARESGRAAASSTAPPAPF